MRKQHREINRNVYRVLLLAQEASLILSEKSFMEDTIIAEQIIAMHIKNHTAKDMFE